MTDWFAVASTQESLAAGLGMGVKTPERRAPGWQVDPGDYEVLVGRSSQGITGTATVTVTGPSR